MGPLHFPFTCMQAKFLELYSLQWPVDSINNFSAKKLTEFDPKVKQHTIQIQRVFP